MLSHDHLTGMGLYGPPGYASGRDEMRNQPVGSDFPTVHPSTGGPGCWLGRFAASPSEFRDFTQSDS